MELLTPVDPDQDGDPDPASDQDPDPDQPAYRPADRPVSRTADRPAAPLYVPVRLGSAGHGQLRFARTPLGERTAIGFTSRRALAAVLGERQPWIRLAEPALRALAEPLGAGVVTVDPQFTAPATAPSPALTHRSASAHPCARRAAGLSEAMSV